jgi:hypothetical protein
MLPAIAVSIPITDARYDNHMVFLPRRRIDPLLPLQLALVLAGLALTTFAPPASGRMLLVPIGGAARQEVIRTAVAHGALLIAPGRMGSMVVFGQRARLIVPLLAQGIVVLAGPAAECGGEDARS